MRRIKCNPPSRHSRFGHTKHDAHGACPPLATRDKDIRGEHSTASVGKVGAHTLLLTTEPGHLFLFRDPGGGLPPKVGQAHDDLPLEAVRLSLSLSLKLSPSLSRNASTRSPHRCCITSSRPRRGPRTLRWRRGRCRSASRATAPRRRVRWHWRGTPAVRDSRGAGVEGATERHNTSSKCTAFTQRIGSPPAPPPAR